MIAIILGTRPDIIKFSPIIYECLNKGKKFKLIHTGQHYSPKLSRTFFCELGLPPPDHNIKVGSGTHAQQTGVLLQKLESVLNDENVKTVVVLGDTNSALAGALVARKMKKRLVHIESGYRSFDWRMPEEHNRRLIDHIADINFSPTQIAQENLYYESVIGKKLLVGNITTDVIDMFCPPIERRKEHILATLHREENVDDPSSLGAILKGLTLVADHFDQDIIIPTHPRTMKRMNEFGFTPMRLGFREPFSYRTWMIMLQNAKLVLTDSGGIQEEAAILNVPAVILREKSERVETLNVGASYLSGIHHGKILDAAKKMITRTGWENPYPTRYSDGQKVSVSERIIHYIGSG